MKNGGDLVIYDEAGREIERQPISDFGEAMGKISRNFGKDGLLAESIWTDPKGNLLRKDVFNYLNGKVSEMFTYNAAAVMVEKTVYSYDDKARLSAETYYDSGEPVAKTVYKYDGLDKPAEIALKKEKGSKATAPVGPCLGAHRVTFS